MGLLRLALLLSAAPLLAQSHDLFPPNFAASPCAAPNSCETFTDSDLPGAAYKFYGLQLDMNWVQAHRDEVLKSMETACRRHASCLAQPGTTFWFCDDVLAAEAHEIAKNLFPGDPQFKNFLETWLLGIDVKAAKEKWQAAQACASKLPPPQHNKPLEIWMTPAVLPPDFKGKVTFFAQDPETRLPVLAEFSFEKQVVYAPANPAGRPATTYPFDYELKFKRVPNADGHTDVMPPTVTVTAPGYPEIKFPLAVEVPKMIVEMKPKAEALRRGKNNITIEARDAASGKPVEARVMLGDEAIGETNAPITLELKGKGEHPEIWVTSLFDKYSDVVVTTSRTAPRRQARRSAS